MALLESHFSDVEELQLLISALLGDVQAFDQLVPRYRRALIAVAEPILHSREAAEDVAQEAFLIAFKELPQLSDLSKFASWLYSITRHRACRLAARENRFETHEPSTLDLLVMAHGEDLRPHPADVLNQQFEQERVIAALWQLPTDYQIALRLRYYEEWPVARIADFLGLPITTVKWRLHQGRQLMRRQLSKPSEDNFYERNELTPGQPGYHPTATPVWNAGANHSTGQGSQPDRMLSGSQPQYDPAI